MPLLRPGAFAVLPFLASSHLKERPPGGEPAALQLGGGGVIQEQRPTDYPVDQGPQLSELRHPLVCYFCWPLSPHKAWQYQSQDKRSFYICLYSDKTRMGMAKDNLTPQLELVEEKKP